MEAVTRIPDKPGVALHIGNPAVDVLVFPEARRLKRHLQRVVVTHPAERRFHRLGKVRIDAGEDIERQRADDVVGFDRAGFAGARMTPDYLHAFLGLTDLHDFPLAFDDCAQPRLKRFGDVIHAAHRLQHGGLPVNELVEHDRDPQIRERLFAESEEFGATAMHKRLAVLDADAAALIPEQNVRRVIRALEVIELTGEPYAASLPRDEKSYYPHAHQFAIRVEREVLNQRISERVAQMWREGFVSEVEALLLQGLREGRTARAAIGYAQVLAALEGQLSAEFAMEETVTSTRQYARRQGTWFAREPRITWLTGPRERLLERILESSGNS